MTITQKKLPLKMGDNLKIQKVSNSEKIQKVDLNVERLQTKNVSSLKKRNEMRH
jgi:hypothetical protein